VNKPVQLKRTGFMLSKTAIWQSLIRARKCIEIRLFAQIQRRIYALYLYALKA